MTLLEVFNEVSVKPQNIKELKDLILNLAVQGKLTVHWREVNTTVEHISAAEKFTADELPIELQKLPSSWTAPILEETAYINGGFAFKSSLYKSDGMRVVRISDFDEDGFKDKNIVRYNYSNEHKKYVLEEGNILMAMTGGTVGKRLYVDNLPEQMIVNQRVATIKVHDSQSSEYVNIVLGTNQIQNVIKNAKNSTNDNISMRTIKGFVIPLPPLEEQKEIVRVVHELFQEIDNLSIKLELASDLKEDFTTSALRELTTSNDVSQIWNTLQQQFNEFFDSVSGVKKLRETILELAVQGKLTANWREEYPNLEPASELLKKIQAEKQQLITEKKIKRSKSHPDPVNQFKGILNWNTTSLANLGITQTGTTPATSDRTNYGDFIPFIGPADISNDQTIQSFSRSLSKSGLTKGRLIPENSLMMVCIGGSIGKCNINSMDVSCNQQINCITPILIPAEFIRVICQSKSFQKEVKINASGSATPVINRTKWESIVVPVPPLDEQIEIVRVVDSLMGLCNQLEEAITLKEEQAALLMKYCVAEALA